MFSFYPFRFLLVQNQALVLDWPRHWPQLMCTWSSSFLAVWFYLDPLSTSYWPCGYISRIIRDYAFFFFLFLVAIAVWHDSHYCACVCVFFFSFSFFLTLSVGHIWSVSSVFRFGNRRSLGWNGPGTAIRWVRFIVLVYSCFRNLDFKSLSYLNIW